jgi:hypothetical protein
LYFLNWPLFIICGSLGPTESSLRRSLTLHQPAHIVIPILPASDPIGELSMTDAAVSHMAVVAEPRSRAPALGEEGRGASGIAGIGAISRIGGGEPGWCYFIWNSPIPGPLRSVPMTCSTEGSREQRKSGAAGGSPLRQDHVTAQEAQLRPQPGARRPCPHQNVCAGQV